MDGEVNVYYTTQSYLEFSKGLDLAENHGFFCFSQTPKRHLDCVNDITLNYWKLNWSLAWPYYTNDLNNTLSLRQIRVFKTIYCIYILQKQNWIFFDNIGTKVVSCSKSWKQRRKKMEDDKVPEGKETNKYMSHEGCVAHWAWKIALIPHTITCFPFITHNLTHLSFPQRSWFS